MTPSRLYSNEITSAEAALGFELVYVSDPEHVYFGHGSITHAVVLALGPGNRLIKFNNPVGGFSFPRQVFGTFHSGGKPDWKSTFSGVADPALSITAAIRGIEEFKVIPAKPVIELRCPECNKEFEVAADSLPIQGRSLCPDCQHTGATETFNAFNL